MNIQLLSDLHLETQPDVRIDPVSGADVLVLAGDIGSYQPGSRLDGADFGLERFSPRHGWPTPVLFVAHIAAVPYCDTACAHVGCRNGTSRIQ